jgi:hypothetical protein
MQTFTSLIFQLVAKSIHTYDISKKIIYIYRYVCVDAIDIHLLYVHDEARARLGHGLPEEPPSFQFDHLFC